MDYLHEKMKVKLREVKTILSFVGVESVMTGISARCGGLSQGDTCLDKNGADNKRVVCGVVKKKKSFLSVLPIVHL